MTKKMHVCFIAAALAMLLITACFAGCTDTAPTSPQTTATPAATGPKEKLLLATTTSLYDTGLLTYLEPRFESMYNVDLLITSQGTGKAIELAKRGDADVLLVHSPTQELAFLKDGYGLNRRSFATNSFLIIGPETDPAGILDMTPENALTTLRLKGTNKTENIYFVSRGDNSGTHSAEKNVWSKAGYDYAANVQKSGNWYIEAGKGMGDTLQMASEKGAYALTDEGTYLAYKSKLDLVPLVSTGPSLLNIYSVMTVYNDKQPVDKIQMSNNFINFLIAPETQNDIATFGVEKYGKALFTPLSVTVPTAPVAGWIGDYTTPATATAPAPAVTTAAPAASTT